MRFDVYFMFTFIIWTAQMCLIFTTTKSKQIITVLN